MAGSEANPLRQPSGIAYQTLVERVPRRRCPCFPPSADDVTLGGGEGFMTQEVLQFVHADIGVGEVRSEGVATVEAGISVDAVALLASWRTANISAATAQSNFVW